MGKLMDAEDQERRAKQRIEDGIDELADEVAALRVDVDRNRRWLRALTVGPPVFGLQSCKLCGAAWGGALGPEAHAEGCEAAP